MRFEVQPKGYQGQLEESFGQKKGSEGKPEGQPWYDPVSCPVPRDGIRDGTGRVFSKGFLKKPVKTHKNS